MMDITTVIINFQTPGLLKVAVNSFKTFYPDTKLLLIDNGSKDDGISKSMIEDLSSKHKDTEAVLLENNIFHGPAMDKAIREHIDSKYTFFLDSDTETVQGGFLEKMVEMLSLSDHNYGVGEIIKANKRGYKAEDGEDMLLTPYMMIDNEIYKGLKPFIHHGQPTIYNFIDARKKGYKLEKFEVSAYINHLWRGTASKFGYGLGIKGKIDFILNKLGI